LKKFQWRTVSHWRHLTLEQKKSVRSPPPEEEGAAKTMCDRQTANPIPCPLAPLGGGEKVEHSGVKLSLGRREG